MDLFASLVMTVAVAITVIVVDVTHALPAPGKTDAAKIQKNMSKNKGTYGPSPPASLLHRVHPSTSITRVVVMKKKKKN